MINWHVSNEDHDNAAKLGKLAAEQARTLGVEYEQRTAIMDITAAHANGNPLKLAEMVAAIGTEHETDVLHDLFGIRRHIDRSTGKLGDCFSPRYSQSERAGVQAVVDQHFSIDGLRRAVQGSAAVTK